MADKPVFPSLLNIGEEKKKKEERERRKDPNFPWMPLGVAGGLGLGGLGAYHAGRGMGALGEATFADFYDYMHKARGGAPSFKPWDWVKGKFWEANPAAVASFEADEAKGRYFDAIQPSEALLKARVSSLNTDVLQQGNDVIAFTLNSEDMLGAQMGYFGLGATMMGEPLYEGGATGIDAMMGARTPRQNWWFRKIFPIDDSYAGHGTTKAQFGIDPTRGGWPGELPSTKHKLPGLARGEKIESSPGHKSDSQTDKSRLSGYVLPEALYRGTPETNPRHWKHHARKLRGLDFPNTGGAWLQQPRQQDLAEQHQHRTVARWPYTDPNTGQDVGGYWGGVEGHYGGFSISPAHAMEQLYLETYNTVDGSINKLGRARQHALQLVASGYIKPQQFKEAYIDKFVELWSPVDKEGMHRWSGFMMPQQAETSPAARAKAQAAVDAAKSKYQSFLEETPKRYRDQYVPEIQALEKAVTDAETAAASATRPWTAPTAILGAATATATKQPFVRRKIRNTASKIIDVVERRLAEQEITATREGQLEHGFDPTWEDKYPTNIAAIRTQHAADPLQTTYDKKFVDQTPAIRHVLGLKDSKATAEAMHDVQRHAMKLQTELAGKGLTPLEITKRIYASLRDPQNEQLGTVAQLASTGGGALVFPLSAVAYRAIGEAMAVPGHIARYAKALSPYFKYIGAGMLGLGSIYGIHTVHEYFKRRRRFE